MREEVLALQRKVSGHEHPNTLRAMSDLAASYEAAGRKDEATRLQAELKAMKEKK